MAANHAASTFTSSAKLSLLDFFCSFSFFTSVTSKTSTKSPSRTCAVSPSIFFISFILLFLYSFVLPKYCQTPAHLVPRLCLCLAHLVPPLCRLGIWLSCNLLFYNYLYLRYFVSLLHFLLCYFYFLSSCAHLVPRLCRLKILFLITIIITDGYDALFM